MIMSWILKVILVVMGIAAIWWVLKGNKESKDFGGIK
jgi:hypothetical protein